MPGTGGVYNLDDHREQRQWARRDAEVHPHDQPGAVDHEREQRELHRRQRRQLRGGDSGFPAPSSSESGALPAGVSFDQAPACLAACRRTERPGIIRSLHRQERCGKRRAQNFTLTVNDAVCIAAPATYRVVPGRRKRDRCEGRNQWNARDGAGYAAGKVGQGFTFNGSTAVVEVPDNAAWDSARTTSRSQAWVKFNAVSGSDVLVGAQRRQRAT